MLACLVAMLALGVPGAAVADSSGEITRAQVSPDWTTASIAGNAVRSNGCEAPPKEPKPGPEEEVVPPILPESPPWKCGWIPFVTIGPGSSQADCSADARSWNSFGEGIQIVWTGSETKGAGPAAFDLDDVGLEHGANAPLICLAAVESVTTRVVCPAVVGFPCPPYAIVHRTHQLDSALLVEEIAANEAPLVNPVEAGTIPFTAGEQPCRKTGKRQKRSQKQAGVALGPSIRVQGKPSRVRRCKTG